MRLLAPVSLILVLLFEWALGLYAVEAKYIWRLAEKNSKSE